MPLIEFNEDDYLPDAYPLLETYLRLEGEVTLVRIRLEAERIARTRRSYISALIVGLAHKRVKARERRLLYAKLLDLIAGGLLGAVLSSIVSSTVSNVPFDSQLAFLYTALALLLFLLGLRMSRGT